MISIKTIILFILAGIVMALPQPHTGMVDNDNVRDVGVIYTTTNFEGSAKFVFEIKAKPECLPLCVVHGITKKTSSDMY
jgi:hypothetical protein